MRPWIVAVGRTSPGLCGSRTLCDWVHPRYPFLLPVKVSSRVFRGKFANDFANPTRISANLPMISETPARCGSGGLAA
jgi:hypothetical protein